MFIDWVSKLSTRQLLADTNGGMLLMIWGSYIISEGLVKDSPNDFLKHSRQSSGKSCGPTESLT